MLAIRRADLSDAAHVRSIEAYVAGHPQGSAFHRPAWSRAVEQGCGQTAHYLVAGGEGRLLGALPLTEVHSPLFGRALASAGFAVGGGPIADDTSVVDALADAAWNLAGRLSCPSLELRGGTLPSTAGWHVEQGTYAGFARTLAADDEAELLAIPRK
ncbi:MAG: FemAB, partial [Rhizorhabdus sp.]